MPKRLLQKQCTVVKYWTGTINNVNEIILATKKYDEIEDIIKKLKLNVISKETKIMYYYAKTLV